MLLALSIVSEQGAALGPTAYKVFDERGGSIGRVAGNDWVLPDPQNFVSSRHARVRAAGGVFYLEDTSSNGTFINAPDQPTSRTEPQRLADGDRLYIGDYEIIVQLIPSAPTEISARPPAAETVMRAPVQAPADAVSRSAGTPPPSALGLGTVDPLAALGGAVASGAAGAAPLSLSADSPLAALGIDPARLDADMQAALLAGLRAGFNAVLTQLHPQQLEELYDRKLKRTAMLGIGNKAKYWEMYRAQFDEIDRDRDTHFRLLFGEQFARAYNARLRGSR
jgi:predicted component of type VI protein secretion system